MKSILLVLFNFFILSIATGQTVPSSCDGSNEVVEAYLEDAKRLTLDRFVEEGHPLAQSVEIPDAYSDTLLNALLAVYNATELPARDTVVEILNIHTFNLLDLRSLLVSADSSVGWMEAIRNGQVPTGYEPLDDLVSTYGLWYGNYFNHFNLHPYHTVEFNSIEYYNTTALGLVFESLEGVHFSSPNGWVGDGNNITAEIHPEYVLLSYSHGWGDCPAGCIARRFWDFKVFYDCSVEFDGSHGENLYPLSTHSAPTLEFEVFPNPFSEGIRVSGISGPFNFAVISLDGKVVSQGVSNDEMINELNGIPPGFFLLEISTEKGRGFTKILRF